MLKVLYGLFIILLLLSHNSEAMVIGKKKPVIQVYFNHGGYVMVNGDLVKNGTILNFKVESNVTFGALPNNTMLFNNFHHGNITVTINPYFVIVEQDTTVWCIFCHSSSDDPEDLIDLTDEFAVVILVSLILFTFALIKKSI